MLNALRRLALFLTGETEENNPIPNRRFPPPMSQWHNPPGSHYIGQSMGGYPNGPLHVDSTGNYPVGWPPHSYTYPYHYPPAFPPFLPSHPIVGAPNPAPVVETMHPTSVSSQTTKVEAIQSIPPQNLDPTLKSPENVSSILKETFSAKFPAPGVTKGSSAFFNSLINLKDEFKTEFLTDSSIHGPVYLTFQTPFMKKILEESIETWNRDNQDGPHSARHGLVTDGDHSFFVDGILNMTCAFSHVLTAWVPILYTWALRQDVDHNLPHFRYTSQQIVKYLQSKNIPFDPKYLLHVMDFSASQRKAHAEAYADAVILTKPYYYSLSLAAQVAERSSFVQEAMQAQSGCDFHFWQSAERIKANGQIIPAESVDQFMRFLHTMTSKSTTSEQFMETTQSFSSTFPRAQKWLAWWLRPSIASMIFPCQSAVDSFTGSQIPSTANPIEHGHSLLHHAVGKDQDLITGIRKLFLHISEFEKQYEAIKDGHFDPPGVREYQRPKRKAFDPNDGRAPDTLATLHPQGLRDVVINSPHFVQAYQWDSPNSCFFDNGLEAWFRAVLQWPDEILEAFQKAVPHNSFLGTLFFHYKRRLKFLQSPTAPLTVSRDLALMQGITRDRIFNVWKLYREASDYGCSREWLDFAIQDGNPSKEIKGFFGVYNLFNYQCSEGHVFEKYATEEPQVLLTLHHTSAKLCSVRKSGKAISLNDYFTCFIPRNTVGEALLSQPDIGCSSASASCALVASHTHISTLWPQVLNIRSENMVVDPKIKILFENHLTIPDLDGSTVEYDLVARILYGNNHFVSEFQFAGHTFTYDDMVNHGKLVESKNNNLLLSDQRGIVYYVYHRTSKKFKTRRLLADILNDHREYSKHDAPIILDLSKSDTEEDTHVSHAVDTGHNPQDSLNVCKFPSCPQSQIQDSELVKCTLCNSHWHETCVIDTFASEYTQGCGEAWCCSTCINAVNGPWDRILLGEFILLKFHTRGRYYPAQIIRHDKSTVHLKWHKGNIYIGKHCPKSPESEFCLSVQECFYAYHRDVFLYSKTNIGSVKWPARLSNNDPVLKEYKNQPIQLALEDAFHSILQILIGTRDHPIMALFRHWLKQYPPAKIGSTRDRLEGDFQRDCAFNDLFNLDILPGDQFLIEPLLVTLQFALLNEESADGNVLVHFRLIERVLFTVVITRVYMQRPPKDDLQIYMLALNPSKIDQSTLHPDDPLLEAKLTCLSRTLTDSEKAILACISPEKDALGNWFCNKDLIGCFTGFSLVSQVRQIEQVIDYSPDMNIKPPVMKTLTKQGSSYVFRDSLTDPGLTGGPDYIPVSAPQGDDSTKVSSETETRKPPMKTPLLETFFKPIKTTALKKTSMAKNPDKNAPNTRTPLNTTAPRVLIVDYMAWKNPKASEGSKCPNSPENVRRSKRLKKE